MVARRSRRSSPVRAGYDSDRFAERRIWFGCTNTMGLKPHLVTEHSGGERRIRAGWTPASACWRQPDTLENPRRRRCCPGIKTQSKPASSDSSVWGAGAACGARFSRTRALGRGCVPFVSGMGDCRTMSGPAVQGSGCSSTAVAETQISQLRRTHLPGAFR